MKTRYERARELVVLHDPAGMFQPDEIQQIACAIEQFVHSEIIEIRKGDDMRVYMTLERIACALERLAR